MQYRSVNGDLVPPVEEFDIIDGRRPRGVGFVSIGYVVRPMVQRLAEHLADKGVIDTDRAAVALKTISPKEKEQMFDPSNPPRMVYGQLAVSFGKNCELIIEKLSADAKPETVSIPHSQLGVVLAFIESHRPSAFEAGCYAARPTDQPLKSILDQ